MKLKILVIPKINIFINVFKFIWVPIIISLRDKSREVVYNYWLANNMAYRLPNGLKLVHGYLTNDNNVTEVYRDTDNLEASSFTLRYLKVSKFKYYFYLVTVYIWLDDTLSADVVSYKLAVDILESKYLTKLYGTELHRICKIGKGDSFTNYNSFNRNNLDISIGLLYVTLLYNTNNNFKNVFYYSIKKKTILGIGYKKEVKINGINMYKWSI